MRNDEEFCDRCDGCGWYEGGKTIQTTCEVCSGTGIVKRVKQNATRAVADVHWLRKIEALRPGDACEFHYPARAEWLRGTVRRNGGSGYWEIFDETTQKSVSCIYIEQVRLPGQTEAWPHSK